MVKLTATTGIQKRIFYKQGKYQIDGSLEVFASMVSVIRTEPAVRADPCDIFSCPNANASGPLPIFPHCLTSGLSCVPEEVHLQLGTQPVSFSPQPPRSLCLSESNI
jgi:hypothetical protein